MSETRKPAAFVHLRVKSAYSLLEGALRPGELANLARLNEMPAVAVTDVNNLFGTYELSDAIAKAGVQPIVGCLVSVEFEAAAPTQGSRRKPPALPLLVQNAASYRNLAKLLSAAFLGAEPGDWPHVTPELLAIVATREAAEIATPAVPVAGTVDIVRVGDAAEPRTIVSGIDAPHVLVIAMLFESAGMDAYHQ